MLRFAFPLVLAAALSSAGCLDENRPTMRPGEDCMSCHFQGGEANGLRWSAAGTVYAKPDQADPGQGGLQGVHVLLTDALGKNLELTTNSVGNFYTAEPLTPPLTIRLEYQGVDAGMSGHPTAADIYGEQAAGHGIGCNGCHSGPADPNTGTVGDPTRFSGQAPGRVYITPPTGG